jgi:organic hydroperoxide reductase OsmC/OhrA
MTEVILEPMLLITKEVDKVRAERILQKSEAACLISNSIKLKVSMIPNIQCLN